MGHYDTSDLHRRQYSDDVGHAVLGSSAQVASTTAQAGRSWSPWWCSPSDSCWGCGVRSPGWAWS